MKRPCLHKSCPGPLVGDNALDRAGAAIRGAGGGALRTLGAFARDTSGATAIMVVLLVPVLIGFMGLSVDVGLWYTVRRGMQNMADAAAISGAFEIANGSATSIVEAATQSAAGSNGFDPADGSVITINVPPTTGPSAGEDGSIEVIISRPMVMLFTGAFSAIRGETFTATATVRAVAGAVASEPEAACFVSLDPTAKNAIGFQSAQVQLTGCGIKVNSDNSSALGTKGNSAVAVDKSTVSVTGDVSVTGAAKLIIINEDGDPVPPKIGTPRAPDPFADVDVPSYSGCLSGPGGTTINGGTATLLPGVYCGGLRIQNASVTFKPGTYIIEGGDLEFQTKAQLVGDGVVFVLTGKPPSTTGSLKITSEAQLQMTPPDSGDLKGIMFYQDRDAPSKGGDKNIITGKSQLQTDGAFYFPAQELEISGNAQIQVTSNECTGFIASTLSLDSTQIQIDCNPDSESAVKVSFGSVVKLSE